ncbi:PREDICTED: zinc finger BED domain-containing protein 1-like [Rhagoletis zephyria]|uniref:zinc finger BED domain-containing protein 1-like n=1 Tax=Rhagoletis zephyria TaxID=28612 RepID=UPI000811A004|nr:PREDICTED: zinc finger BED domain-containing protein 1-like [Rhagoletis zephyria]XP_036320325.1 zinc finger BED domain-containing protein 1-like [Rhagoletis pomonella]
MSLRKRSGAWNFFSNSEGGKEVKCTICGQNMACNNSTSSLATHLKAIHKRDKEQDLEMTTDVANSECAEPSPAKNVKRRRKNEDGETISNERQETISRAIARLIATNMLPISLVATPGFHEFMKVMEPAYKVPCEQSIHSRLQLLYNDVKDRVQTELSDASSVAITVDEWTSRTQNAYISVEAQYINSNHRLCHVTLCNEELPGRPTAENISASIEVALTDWGLTEKTQAITHDSANVMNAAAAQLISVPNSVKCSAHLLQLVVKDAMSSVPKYEEICNKGRNLVRYFHRSTVAKTTLFNRQVQLGLRESRLLQCVETRWNSKYRMCESLLDNRNAISLVIADRSETKINEAIKLEILETDWTNMEKLVEVLNPFDVATNVLCTEKNISISIIRPLVHYLINNHMASSSCEQSNEEI